MKRIRQIQGDSIHIAKVNGDEPQQMREIITSTMVGGVTPTGNIDITQAGVTDVTNYATATVPQSDASAAIPSTRYITENGQRKWRLSYSAYAESAGWVDEGPFGEEQVYKYNAVPANTAITPTESAQTIGGANTMMEGAVTVNAIPSNYVGTGVARKSSSDLTASGATVTAPAGYYESAATKTVTSGTEGTPTATKGAVSNHSVTVTPSVTNTAGYIDGGTKTGTGVSVSASELVSGTYNVTSSGTKDVTNYASASIPAGGATASATKGTVTNHSVTVTPSVTKTAGYVTAGTESGTAVTVSASELVSGSETKTANGTYDVTNLAELVVSVSGGGSPVKTATGTFTGNGTRTIDVSCDFEPDLVYVTSDPGTTASSGTVAFIIARDMMAASRYRNNSTTNSHYAVTPCVNLNTSGSSYSWRATYANSKVTLYSFSNNARALLTNGRTYTYKFVKWTT